MPNHVTLKGTLDVSVSGTVLKELKVLPVSEHLSTKSVNRT
jgi:hypothetical protein